MSVIAVERIKLFSTRSPWWCMIVAAVLSVGLSALLTGLAANDDVTVFFTQAGVSLSRMVIMVMAALAITTEYRFGTIRTSFQAIPNRTSMLLGKTAVVAGLAGLVGLVASFGAWAVGTVFAGSADMAIDTGAEWRMVAGQGLVYAIAAVIAVAVGALLRQSAGAVALLVLWPLAVESLVSLIPKVGDDLSRWAPFANADSFIIQAQDFGAAAGEGGMGTFALSPWAALLYFAAWAAGLLAIALFVTNKRDA
ncbi:ABC transporter permease subunit [Kribbella deserti]|uniref:ABC transporter permease subunit n=1 Tax=Kribbella deserti TaxID=1926257 RepID=A0ABV6QSX7_9ACTN